MDTLAALHELSRIAGDGRERTYECKDDGEHGGIEFFFGARWVCRRHAVVRGIY